MRGRFRRPVVFSGDAVETKPWQPYLPYDAVSCRYNEIGTKGHNRSFFVAHLLEALKRRLGRWFLKPMFRLEMGRIFMLPSEAGGSLTEMQVEALRKEIPGLPGISSVSPGFLVANTPEAIFACVEKHFPALHAAYAAAVAEGERTYAVRVNRMDKRFPLRSAELEVEFARRLLKAYPDLRVDLRHAGLRIEIDIRTERTFISCERIAGAGGLPTGSAGGVLAMLSGGFDSPVACYEMMRRGCNVDFLTFHSSPYTPPATLTKVAGLVRKLNEYQKRGRFVAINLAPFQKAVRDNCDEKYRTVLYRRAMVRLAAAVASYFGDLAVVTGDNLGQVASQTLENLSTIGAATRMMILRPLLTWDKLDILEAAERIGTERLSKEEVPDSCTVFAPKFPATRTTVEELLAEEAKLPLAQLLCECLSKCTLHNALTLAEHPFPEILAAPLES